MNIKIKGMKRMINVTKPFLPEISEYIEVLNEIWERGWLTNQGPCVQTLEKEIGEYLDISNINFVTNGTIALQLALKALDITEGEVITTPFSYVATTSSIMLEGCTPVFVDINPETLQIDTELIEEKITANTKAIMAVHVFGLPCEVDKIEEIAKKYNLAVIYDAAHAFGVIYKGKSLLSYGDSSTCSFHATKLFHTVEGGCVVSRSDQVHEKVDLIKRFGHNGDDHICLGTNAKNSELHAAMGLVNLRHVDEIIRKRQEISEQYDSILNSYVIFPKKPENLQYNYAYYPIILESEKLLLAVMEEMKNNNIFPRRYFFPSLNDIDYVGSKSECKISSDIASRILCLPLYPELDKEDVNKIGEIVKNTICSAL